MNNTKKGKIDLNENPQSLQKYINEQVNQSINK